MFGAFIGLITASLAGGLTILIEPICDQADNDRRSKENESSSLFMAVFIHNENRQKGYTGHIREMPFTSVVKISVIRSRKGRIALKPSLIFFSKPGASTSLSVKSFLRMNCL